jgi:small subunit ribosomal protein S6
MILDPNLSEKDVQKIGQETKDLLTNYGATAIADERIERRALAYPVKKHNEGIYVFIDFTGPNTTPQKVRYDLRHREGLLRMAFVSKPLVVEPVGDQCAPPVPVPPPEPEVTSG